MFLRLLYQSFFRQRRRKLLAGAAIMLGMTVATAMIAVGTDVGDKINSELRAFGPNLVVYPLEDTLDVEVGGISLKPASEGAYLNEADLPKIKHIFWGHNILGYSPMLSAQVELDSSGSSLPIVGTYFAKEITLPYETFTTGVRSTHPWWKVDGEWPNDDSDQVLLGKRLADKLRLKQGEQGTLSGQRVRVSGILSTGSTEEDAIVAPLSMVQQVIGRPGAVRRLYVRALTKPEDDFARRDPKTMAPKVLERWSCSPYANSIAYQINEAIPNAHAEQIRAVAQNEGTVLSRISGLMVLVSIAALLAAGLAVSAAMAAAVLERRREIGLMKSLGANSSMIASLFFSESVLLALAGGLVGFLLGSVMAKKIGLSIFGSQIEVQPILLPVVLILAVFITFLGTLPSVRKATQYDPATVLRGDVT